jgi:hypothetical protein
LEQPSDQHHPWLELGGGQGVPPIKHVGTESRLPWLHLADNLPASRTETSMRPDRIDKMQTFQHPDHDTPDDWAPKGVGEG